MNTRDLLRHLNPATRAALSQAAEDYRAGKITVAEYWEAVRRADKPAQPVKGSKP